MDAHTGARRVRQPAAFEERYPALTLPVAPVPHLVEENAGPAVVHILGTQIQRHGGHAAAKRRGGQHHGAWCELRRALNAEAEEREVAAGFDQEPHTHQSGR